MRTWRHVVHGVRALFGREGADRETADEARHFFEEAEADLVARGATPEEARRTVRLRYGDETAAREDVAFGMWESHVEHFLMDVGLALRRLRKDPGFAALVTVILGLGVGSATAIYSVVRPTLIEPLHYPGADRIVSMAYRADAGEVQPVAFGTYLEVEARSDDFEHLSAFRPWRPTLAGESEPVRLDGQRVGAEYFHALGTPPRFGPGFDAAQDHPGGARSVVLSHALWQSLGSEPDVVGTAVRLDGEPYTVVGVMPRDFENVTMPSARVWTLLQYDRAVASFDTRGWGKHLGFLGRLRPDVPLAGARANLDAIAAAPRLEFARPEWAALEEGLLVRPLLEVATASARPTALLLTGAAAFLILIACVNLAILFSGRAARRQGELALRETLGAGRQRIAKQLLTETFVLAAAGVLAALVVAGIGIEALVLASPQTLRNLDRVQLDGPVVTFALALGTLIGVVAGLAPLARSRGRPLHEAVKGTAPGIARGQTALRRALVVGEVSAALVLLVGAGLLIRTTDRLFSLPLGFDPSETVVMQVHGTSLEPGDAGIHRFFDLALDAVGGAVGVSSVAWTTQMPLSGDAEAFGVRPADLSAPAETGGSAFRYAVTPSYFDVMDLRLAAGRLLRDSDDAGSPRVAVVSRSLARRLFGDRDPIGRGILVGAPELPPFEVVGVVEDVRHVALDSPETQAVYTTAHQWHWADRVRWLALRSDLGLEETVLATQHAVWSVDGNQPIVNVQRLDTLVERSEALRAFVRLVLAYFALLAVTLAAAGLYGVLASSVGDRRRELGVRAALGASRDRILGQVFGQGMILAVLGIGLGAVVAAVTRGLVAPFLFGVTSLDPITYVAVVALLLVVTGIACGLPAVRAARVDPLTVLRSE